MPKRILLQFRSVLLVFVMASLAGCTFYTTEFLSEHYNRDYRLTENAMAFAGMAPPQPGQRGRLMKLGREWATPPQFPIGSRVRVIKIRKHHVFYETEIVHLALLRIGEGSDAVEVFADWPDVLEMMEEVP